MLSIARFTFLEAVKNRLFILVFIGMIGLFALGQFAAELAVTEAREVQISLIAFLLRIAAVFLTSLFVITSVIREFNEKTVDMIVAMPLPRYVYYLGKLAGFFALAVVISGLLSTILLLQADLAQVLAWTWSLICELLIMIALCLFFLLTLGNVITACAAVAAFYILARTITTIQLISASPILESTTLSQKFINIFIDGMAYLLPGLDYFAESSGLAYGGDAFSHLGLITLQTIIYVALLAAAALFDLYRKNF